MIECRIVNNELRQAQPNSPAMNESSFLSNHRVTIGALIGATIAAVAYGIIFGLIPLLLAIGGGIVIGSVFGAITKNRSGQINEGLLTSQQQTIQREPVELLHEQVNLSPDSGLTPAASSLDAIKMQESEDIVRSRELDRRAMEAILSI